MHNEIIHKYSSFAEFINDLEKDESLRDRKYGATYFDLLEMEITEEEKKITELLESFNHINESLENLIEKKSVFDKASELFLSEGDRSMSFGNRSNQQISLELEEGFRSDLNFIAGVIKAEEDLRMKRMIFRVSRGRAIPTFFDLTVENRITVKFYYFNLKFFFLFLFYRKRKFKRKYLLSFSKEGLMEFYLISYLKSVMLSELLDSIYQRKMKFKLKLIKYKMRLRKKRTSLNKQIIP